jgi:hypothetical protein
MEMRPTFTGVKQLRTMATAKALMDRTATFTREGI